MDREVKEAQERFALAAEMESANRATALEALRFAKLGEQWPKALRKKREAEGRPCLTLNRMPTFTRQVVNEARQLRPSIQVHPVDGGADVATAEVYSGIIRNIEYTSNAEVAYDTAFEHAVTCGYGYWRVALDYASDDAFELDIRIERIPNIFSVYGDPHSLSADSSDWRDAFVLDALPLEEFKRRYPRERAVDWPVTEPQQPRTSRAEVLLAEVWARSEQEGVVLKLSDGTVLDEGVYASRADFLSGEGIEVVDERVVTRSVVTQSLMSGAGVLESQVWPGRYIPLVPVYGDETVVDNRRYFRGLIHDAMDAQRMYNYWRTASTELVGLAPRAPFIGPRGAFKTARHKWRNINREHYAYVEYDGPQTPQRQPFAGPPMGVIQEAKSAADDMKAVTGIYDSSLGARSNETSGVAIKLRQRESDESTLHYVDNLSRAIRQTGRLCIDLIPTVYQGTRQVRILGASGNDPQTVQLGRRDGGEGGRGSARGGAVYDLSVGKYDLVVSVGPSYATRREAVSEQMLTFLTKFPQAVPYIGDLLVKHLDWPESDELARRLQAMVPQPPGKGEGEAPSHEIDAYNAQTKRLVGLVGKLPPEMVMQLLHHLEPLASAGASVSGAPVEMTGPAG
ncbi:MAG: portal protein [Candidatus Thiodiazotropha sp.]